MVGTMLLVNGSVYNTTCCKVAQLSTIPLKTIQNVNHMRP